MPKRKLTEQDAIEIRRKWKSGEYKGIDLAKEYGVISSTITSVVKYRTFKKANPAYTYDEVCAEATEENWPVPTQRRYDIGKMLVEYEGLRDYEIYSDYAGNICVEHETILIYVSESAVTYERYE